MDKKKYLKVTQIHSTAGRLPVHKACLKGLGLKRIRHTVRVENTPAVRGMISKAMFLLKVEEAQ